MRRLINLRHLRILGLAAGAVAVSGAAVLVTASAAGLNVGFRSSPHSSQPSTTAISEKADPTAICNAFISHLATDLGKNQSQVNAAIQKAIGETLADEVKQGHLTQAQADALKQRLASTPTPCPLSGVGRIGAPGQKATIGAYMPQLVTAAAAALGVSESQLKTDLAAGKTLSQIAAAKNPPVTEAQFRTNLIAQLKPLLDTAVKNNKLTSTQEQAILQRLQTAPIPYWSTPMKRKAAPPASPKAGG